MSDYCLPSGERISLELEDQITEFLEWGQKINAIKKLRELTSCGLKEAKDLVDTIQTDKGI